MIRGNSDNNAAQTNKENNADLQLLSDDDDEEFKVVEMADMTDLSKASGLAEEQVKFSDDLFNGQEHEKAMMAKEQQESIDSLAINSAEHSAVNLVSPVAQNDDKPVDAIDEAADAAALNE